jgi:hypothetical protein
VRGPKHLLALAVPLAFLFWLLAPDRASAYVGPGPGLEFLPNFKVLLAGVGVALGAILLWPISALLGRLWGGQGCLAEAVGETADDC